MELQKKLNKENTFYRKFIKRLKIAKNDCWEWQGKKNKFGYGRFMYWKKFIFVHRYSYSIFKGDLVKGLVIDHLCRNPRCCNPDHLEQVTVKVNTNRGLARQKLISRMNSMTSEEKKKHIDRFVEGAARAKRIKTHCKRGHEFSKENTYIDAGGWRNCKTCAAMNRQKRMAA